MLIYIPKETDPRERRAPMVPDVAARLVSMGAEVAVEAGLGAALRVEDAAYHKAGARVSDDRDGMLSSADVILRLRRPPLEHVAKLKAGAIHISMLDPFNKPELIAALASQGISAIAMELIPRTTRAQKMDALSSQASLSGYVSVIVAAERLDKILPMMMTPAGTIAPARVFVIGAGVAGLQAIATAKRLGARVDAFDTRPIVEEQVQSLGARFVKIDLGATGQTSQGYATELTNEQKDLQRQGMAKVCSQSDIVITTAQIFGKRAPVIVTSDMLRQMRPGSVVVDLAVETGGNVEGSVLDQEVEINGVRVIGLANLPGHVAIHASQMYASNLHHFVEDYWDTDSRSMRLDLDDEIIRNCLVTHHGEIVNDSIRSATRG